MTGTNDDKALVKRDVTSALSSGILPDQAPARRARRETSDLVARDPEVLEIPPGRVTQSIMRALLNGDEYILFPEESAAQFRRSTHLPNGEIVIRIEPGRGETWEQVLGVLAQLGDEVVDTFCAVLAIAVDRHGAEQIYMPFYISPDEILELCRRKRTNRAYTAQQRKAVLDALDVLSHVSVRSNFPERRRRGRELQFHSAIVDLLGDVFAEVTVPGAEPQVKQRNVKIGDWSRLAPAPGPEVDLLLRKILEYHAVRGMAAKRLGRWLALQARDPEARFVGEDGVLRLTMEQLLEQAGINPWSRSNSKNPGRFRATIEGALTILRRDGVLDLAEWELTQSTIRGRQMIEQIEQRAYGWFDTYLQVSWRFQPHRYTLEAIEASSQLALPSPSTGQDAD